MNRRLLHLIVTKSLGCLLLAAAGLKIYGFGATPVGAIGIFSSPSFQVGLIEFEVLLGICLLFGKSPIGSWIVAMAGFASFAAVSFYLGWTGQASCGCFGQLSVSPWDAFAIDLAALLALLVGRPDLEPLWDYPRWTVVRALNRTVAGLAGLALLLALLAGLTSYWFGSTDAALANVRGERVSVRPSLVDIGNGGPAERREATVELLNRTNHSIRVVGGSFDCSCKVTDDLPLTIPARESRPPGMASDPVKEQPSEELQQRFLKEAPDRWKEYSSRADRLDGTITHLFKVGDKVEGHNRMEYKHNSNCRLILLQPLAPAAVDGDLIAYNRAYTFSLTRHTSDSPWTIRAIEARKDGANEAFTAQMAERKTALRDLVRAFSVDLADLVRQPGFRVVRATRAERGGRELAQIDFENPHPLREQPFSPIQAGTLLLDPGRFWYLRAAELQCKWTNDEALIKVEPELSELPADFPIPRRLVCVSQKNEKEPIRTWLVDYELHETQALPADDDFTLSAFGFPEPSWVEQKKARWYLWFALAGGICLLLGMLWRWRKKQASAVAGPV